MKIRLFVTLAIAMMAASATAQTVQEAKQHLARMCTNHEFIFDGGVARFIDSDGFYATFALKDIDTVMLKNGKTYTVCRTSDNSFASPDSENSIPCVTWGSGKADVLWFFRGCRDAKGVTRAVHFLVKQHNPDVELVLE